MRMGVIIAAVVVVLVGGVGGILLQNWFFDRGSTEPEVIVEGLVEEPVDVASQGKNEVLTGGGPEAVDLPEDDLSVPAFANQEFTGSDFNIGRVLAENSAYTRYYITYISEGLKISGIMNVPKGAGPWPLLVLNHGFIDPAVYTNGRGLKREQDYLARRGYVVIHPDYRGHADSDNDPNTDRRFRFGYAADVIGVVMAAKELPDIIDTTRVGMLGHSMGGGVNWRVAVAQPDMVKAFVQFAPVSADERDNFDKWIRRRADVAQEILAEYGEPNTNDRFWNGISPINYFDRVEAPVLIHHGTADESVPIAWSERAAAELAAQGKDVTLHVYPGEPHEFIDAWSQVMSRTVEFFDQHVKRE